MRSFAFYSPKENTINLRLRPVNAELRISDGFYKYNLFIDLSTHIQGIDDLMAGPIST